MKRKNVTKTTSGPPPKSLKKETGNLITIIKNQTATAKNVRRKEERNTDERIDCGGMICMEI